MRILAVSLLVALIASSVSTAALPLGGDVLVLNGDVLITEDITAESIIVLAGCWCRFGANVTLTATEVIDVRGALRPEPFDAPWSLTLVGGSVDILGTVLTASGRDADGQEAVMNGSSGGDLTIRWAAAGQFFMASGASIIMGNGGAGADVVLGEATAPGDVTGGRGGDGGRLILDGASARFLGEIVGGSGGRGGHVLLPADVTAEGQWVLRGGDGGKSRLEFTTAITELDLIVDSLNIPEDREVIAMRAGNGGDAVVLGGGCSPGAAFGGAGGSGWTGGQGGRAVAVRLGCVAAAGTDATCDIRHGGVGSEGVPAAATGGAGGKGVGHGGAGGSAWAFAGHGGRGGEGADGCRGRGGDGGTGGHAFARGGAGGCLAAGVSALRGEPGGGGAASGSGGRGGDGGRGGEPDGWPGAPGRDGVLSAERGADGGLC